MQRKIEPFYSDKRIAQFAFRQNLLQHADIEVVLTMNERALMQIY